MRGAQYDRLFSGGATGARHSNAGSERSIARRNIADPALLRGASTVAALAATFVVLLALPAVAQETPFSGPQVGESLESFEALMINGPDAGREVDPITPLGDAPILLLFLHQIDRNVGALVRVCEEYAKDRHEAGLKSLIVLLAPDKVSGERRMTAVTRSLRLQSLVGVSVDGVEGPGAYGLNKSVAVTALVAKDRKVTANFAIVQPGMVDSPRILTAAAEHVGGHVKTVSELETEYAKRRQAAMERRRAMKKKKESMAPQQ